MDEEENKLQEQNNEEQREMDQTTENANKAMNAVVKETEKYGKEISKKAAKKAANAAAKVVKKLVKEAAQMIAKLFAKLFAAILSILGPQIIIIIVVMCLIFGTISILKDKFFGTSTNNSDISAYYTATEQGITINDEDVDAKIKELEDEGYNLEAMGITDEFLKKFIQVSAATENVKRGNSGIQGIIHIHKTDGWDEGTSESNIQGSELTYVNEESFRANPNSNNYSIDSSGNLLVATWTSNQETGGEKYTVETINFKATMAQYKVPLTFLIDLASVTTSPKFVEAVADEILNSQIVLTLQETKVLEVTEHEDDDGDTYYTYYRYITLNPVVTKADTFLFTKKADYTNDVTTSSSGDTTTTKNAYTQGPDKEPYYKSAEFEKILRTKYPITTLTETVMPNGIEAQTTTSTKENPTTAALYDTVVNNTSVLFNLFTTDVDNENLVNEFKYVLQLITNRDYGIDSLDISLAWKTGSYNSVTGLYGSVLSEKIWCALTDMGYNEYAVAGVLGNVHYESGGIDPTKIEGGYNENNGGIGICQWTNNGRGTSGRNSQLKAYAASKGVSWQDGDTQVEFLIGELTKGGGANGYAEYQLYKTSTRYDGTAHQPSEWINASDVETATKIFCYSFERPAYSAASASISTRIQYAQMYYDMYTGKTSADFGNTSSGTSGSIVSAVTAETVTLNNGKTYKLYIQGNYPYGRYNATGNGWNTIASSGCCPSSMAVICSGYGFSIDPVQMAEKMTATTNTASSNANTAAKVFNSLGFQATPVYGTLDYNTAKQHLAEGNEILVSTSGSNPSGTLFTKNKHLIPVLSINLSNDTVFVGNPSGNYQRGWFNLSDVVSASTGKWYVLVSKNT